MDDFDSILDEMARRNTPGGEARSVAGVRDRLRPLFDFKIFSSSKTAGIDQILRPGITIVDLNSLTIRSDELASAVVVFTVRKLWNHLYSQGPLESPALRLAVVMDEEHWYTFKGSPIETLLREGRKFGVAVILASQLISDFPQVVIGNTGLKIALRTDDPKDAKMIAAVFRVRAGDLPQSRFEALVGMGKRTIKAKIIPYFRYVEGETQCTRDTEEKVAVAQQPRGEAVRLEASPIEVGAGHIEVVRERVRGS